MKTTENVQAFQKKLSEEEDKINKTKKEIIDFLSTEMVNGGYAPKSILSIINNDKYTKAVMSLYQHNIGALKYRKYNCMDEEEFKKINIKLEFMADLMGQLSVWNSNFKKVKKNLTDE